MPRDDYTFEVHAEDNATDDLNNVQEELDETDQKVDSTGESMDKGAEASEGFAGGISKTEAAAAAGAAAVGALGAQVAQASVQFAKSTAEIERNARAADVSTERYQKLQFAFRQVGLEGDNLQEALNTISERAFDARNGAQGMIDDFGALGIEVSELQGKSPGETFELVAERIGEMESETAAAKGATSLLGDELATQLLPRLRENADLFDDLGKGAERTGNVLSEEVIEDASKAEDNIERLEGAFRGFKKRGLAATLPLLREVTRDLENLAGVEPPERERAGAFTEFIISTGEAAAIATGELAAFTGAMDEVAASETTAVTRQKIQEMLGGEGTGTGATAEQISDMPLPGEILEDARGAAGEGSGTRGGGSSFLDDQTKKLEEQLAKAEAITNEEKDQGEQQKQQAQEAAKKRREAKQELELLEASSDVERARLELEQARAEVRRKGLTGARKELMLEKARQNVTDAILSKEREATAEVSKRTKLRSKMLEESAREAEQMIENAPKADEDFDIETQDQEAGLSATDIEDKLRQRGTIDEGEFASSEQISRFRSGRMANQVGRGVSKGFGSASQGAQKLVKMQEKGAETVAIHNREVSKQVELYSQLGTQAGGLTSAVGKLAKQQFKFGEATEATVGAANALASVGDVAGQFVEGTKKRAGIKAGFHAAAALGAGASAIASAGAAPQLVAAAAKHGIAAAKFGAVASGAVSAGGGGGAAGGGGGGGGAAAPAQPKFNPQREREKTISAFAEQLEAQQSQRPIKFEFNQQGMTALQDSEQVSRDIRDNVEDVARNAANGVGKGGG